MKCTVEMDIQWTASTDIDETHLEHVWIDANVTRLRTGSFSMATPEVFLAGDRRVSWWRLNKSEQEEATLQLEEAWKESADVMVMETRQAIKDARIALEQAAEAGEQEEVEELVHALRMFTLRRSALRAAERKQEPVLSLVGGRK